MTRLLTIAASFLALYSTGVAATLISTGQTIDGGGATVSLNPASPASTSAGISHSGGGSFSISASPPNNDFWISYTNSNIDPDRYDYLQIDFTAMTLADSGVFQLYMADGNTYAGGDLSFNSPVDTTIGSFSLVFQMTGSTTWDSLKNGNPTTGNDIDGVRLDTFNSTAFRGESFTITGITFGDTLTAIPETSSLLLGLIGLLPLLRRRR